MGCPAILINGFGFLYSGFWSAASKNLLPLPAKGTKMFILLLLMILHNIFDI
jgi:hypothetical protein